MLPAPIAAKWLFILQLGFAAGGTYALARVLRIMPAGAIVGAIGFTFGPTLYAGLTWDSTRSVMLAIVPSVVLAIELALRASRPAARAAWTCAAGLAAMQLVVMSPQSSPYGILTIGIWLAWRFLPDAAWRGADLVQRLRAVVITGVGMAVTAGLLVAAAALPILDLIAQSHVAGADYSRVEGGGYTDQAYPAINILARMLNETSSLNRMYFIAAPLVVLGLVAALGAWRRIGVLAFATQTLVFLDLTTSHSVLRPILIHIPGIEATNGHRPIAAAFWIAFPVCMLAASGVHVLLTSPRPRRILGAAIGALAIWFGIAVAIHVRLAPDDARLLDIVPFASDRRPYLGNLQMSLAIATAVIAIVGTLLRSRAPSRPIVIRGVAVSCIGVLLVAPIGVDLVTALRYPQGQEDVTYPPFRDLPSLGEAVDMNFRTSPEPDSVAAFLVQQRDVFQPFRHAAWIGAGDERYPFLTVNNPRIIRLVTNGRPSRLGLYQVYSYNPIQLQGYTDYLAAMNQQPQDYHFSEILGPSQNRSQLFDMLGVRFITVNSAYDDAPPVETWGTVVYENGEYRVFENPYAFPKAWVVHEVRDGADPSTYLGSLNAYMIDGRAVAFVEGPLPAVAPLPPGATDTVLVTRYETNTMTLDASLGADGLVVVSENHARGWTATVDGEPVDILRTNRTFRGIPVTAGDHTIVLHYAPASLTIGLWATAVGGLVCLGAWSWSAVDAMRHRHGPDIGNERVA